MGCFSFLCKNSGEAVNSSSFDGDPVHLFLLKDGKVIEKMFGNYDSYGRVFGTEKDPNDTSMTDTTSLEWGLEWGEVCDLMFHKNEGNGIAAILHKNWGGETPTTRSEGDPEQGWGSMSFRKLDGAPYHKVNKE